MRYIFISIIILISVLEANQKPTVSIFDLDGNLSKSELNTLSSKLRAEIVSLDTFTVIDRSMTENVLKEQKFQHSGLIDDTDKIIELGIMLPSQKLVTGDINQIGKVYSANVYLIDLQSGKTETIVNQSYSGAIEGLLDVMTVLAHEISGTISTNETTGYIASKNSDKYHKKDCHLAKRIKPENQILNSESWFVPHGYVRCKVCLNDNTSANNPPVIMDTEKYVASRNSNKYHKADCVWAKKIKPENRIYYSEEEFKKRGYVRCKVCW